MVGTPASSAKPASVRVAFANNDFRNIVVVLPLVVCDRLLTPASIALPRGLLVPRMQPIVENDGGEQNHAADDVLHFAVNVHDGERVEQGSDQGAADHHAEHAAAATDQADASEHDHEDDVEDISALHHRHLDAAGGAGHL